MEEEEVSRFFDGSPKGYISIGVLALGAGIVLGYFFGKRNKEPTYQVIPPQPDANIDEDEYLDEEKSDFEVISPEVGNIVEKGRVFLERTKTGTIVEFEREADVEEVEETVTNNIFASNDIEWDFEEELKNRTPNEPYVIHKDEFYANEKEYAQHTLTYYAGDNILCDEDDSPVYNHESIVGPMKFGHGSGDPNVFHVRNERRKAEYEILHDPGIYTVEVLGLEIENNDRVKGLKHSGDQVRKFRQE